jgi:hypothetical protein
MKAGTSEEGGVGNMVYVVRIDHDTSLMEGVDVLSARKMLS